jgi:hypothetical protein
MNISYIKGFLYVVGFFMTTGLIMPWIISNDLLPIWATIICVFFVALVWVTICEKPVVRLIKRINKEIEKSKCE